MKAIISVRKRLPTDIRIVLVISVIVGLICLYWGIRFSGKAKDIYPELEFSDQLAPPASSAPGGFYAQPFLLSMSCDEDHEIYYTLDGSEPSLAASRYSGPVLILNRTNERNEYSAIPTSPRWLPPIGNVFKGTVLRAITVDKDQRKSAELVKTFLVFDGSRRYTLPVIAITANKRDLFGYKKGIYVPGKAYTDKDNYIRKNIPLDLPWWDYPSNSLMRGSNSERNAYIEFYESDGRPGFSSKVGVRINGNATRGFPLKSLRIVFREKYQGAVLNYDLFGRGRAGRYHSFVLRNSGNDWNRTFFRDAFIQSTMAETAVDIQDYRPAVVFINGEYWGIHNIRERFDENYIAEKYHLDPDSLTILELSGKLVKGDKSLEKEFGRLLSFAEKNDLSDPADYAFVASQIDVNSFIDFVIANVYFCNSDWPNNNVRFWRPADHGRWRWMLYDTDWGAGYNSMSQPDSDILSKAASTGSVGILFRSLCRNEDFVERFLDRFRDHLNTRFQPTKLLAAIDTMQAELDPEIPDHIRRWRGIRSYGAWLNEVDVLRDFVKRRPAFQVKQLNDFFHLEGSRKIVLKNS